MGNLGRDVKDYYKVNDYILIEGYLSLRQTNKPYLNTTSQTPKRVEVTVLKVYPFLLTYDQTTSKF